MLADQNLF